MQRKAGRHGLPPSRAKGGDAPGTSPGPAGNRLLLGPARSATTITHRLVRTPDPHAGAVTDRGPHRSKAAKGGSGAKPEGKRLATEKRHRADTEQAAKGLPLQGGGKERVAELCLERGKDGLR